MKRAWDLIVESSWAQFQYLTAAPAEFTGLLWSTQASARPQRIWRTLALVIHDSASLLSLARQAILIACILCTEMLQTYAQLPILSVHSNR